MASGNIVIWGNRNAPATCASRNSRPCGPPASSRQYHSANTSTFEAQTDAADNSNAAGDSRCDGSAETSRITAITSSSVTADVTRAVRESKAGKVEFRVEKAGIVHVQVGKASFDTKRLLDNVNAILDTIIRAKPATAKGVYLKGVTISTTMGPGIKMDAAAITAAHK